MTIWRAVLVVVLCLVAPQLVATWGGDGVTAPLRLASLALLLVTVTNPFWGLLLLAGLGPLGSQIQALAATPIAGSEVTTLLLAPFLTGTTLRLILRPQWAPSHLAAPALLLGSVIVASALVNLAVVQQATALWPNFLPQLGAHVRRHFYSDPAAYLVLHTALTWTSALALAVYAEQLLRGDDAEAAARTRTMVRVAIVGAAGFASFAVIRLIEISLRRPEPWAAAGNYLFTRINPHYADFNAAGSYYVLFAVPAVWLMFTRGWRWLAPLAGLLLAALWLTQSRAALFAAVIGVGLAWVGSHGKKALISTLTAAAAIALIWMAIGRVGPPRATAGQAMEIRADMAVIGLRLAAAHPVFGVGLGQFRAASIPLVSDDLAARFPPARDGGENAHNQFVQVLAELGVAGLVGLLWLLVAPLQAALQGLRQHATTPELAPVASGVLAFLVSALLGHPLLITQVLVGFALALGLLAGLAAPPARTISGVTRWSMAAALLLILGSVPTRMDLERRQADLDHLVVGASAVRGELDNVKYRVADRQSVWFVTTQAKVVEVPLRLDAGSIDLCHVAVAIDGQPADEVQVPPGAWWPMRLALASPAKPRVSRAIALEIKDPGCVLLVGPVRGRD